MLVLWLLVFLSISLAKNTVMPWMCLERCGASESEIKQHLKQILDHKETISAVSFELFNLGPNSTLVTNPLYPVVGTLKKAGLKTYPMLSSYPHPPEFLDWMRTLFSDPEPFFKQCVEAAKKDGFSGYNVDFEPTVEATPKDAVYYAAFLDLFARKMHEINVEVTVDIASWNKIWNWPLIGKTSVDKVLIMSTYVYNFTTWEILFNDAVTQLPLHKIGIGLMNPDNGKLTDKELQERFDLIKKARINEVDIWAAPIVDNWWSFLEKFVRE